MRTRTLVISMLLLGLPACRPRSGGPAADLDAFILDRMRRARIPGLGVAIVRDGKVVRVRGYGRANIELGTEVGADTPFLLASISKAVVAVALMQAVEAGLVDLDAEVSGELPFTVDNPHMRDETITARYLATHTSGILDNWSVLDGLYTKGDSPLRLGDFLEGYLVAGGSWYHAERNYSHHRPGRSFEYSNEGAALAAFLVESASGRPFDRWCKERIFEPLGLRRTGWHLSDMEADELAMPYKKRAGRYVPYGHYGYPDYPSGQLRASARDLGRIVAAIAQGGVWSRSRILTSASVDEILRVQLPDVDPDQGLFLYRFRVGDRDVVGHNGGDDGAATEFAIDFATGTAVVVLANTDWDGRLSAAFEAIEARLFEEAQSP